MKVSQRWLNDFVPCLDLSKDALYELLTTKVAEVDHIEEIATPLRSAVAGKILRARPHPAKEKLTIAEVQIGGQEVSVVCGAPQCEAGMAVAYLPPGAVMFPAAGGEAKTVEQRDVGGVPSQGVLVSEAELGLTSDHSGLLELSGFDLQPGSALLEALGGTDVVVEIDNKSLTHRPDLWSHFGFAREISAILGRPLTLNADRWIDDSDGGKQLLEALSSGAPRIRTGVESGAFCRRFTGVLFEHVATVPSPLWMRRRLAAVGAGVRNLLVDLSNYVMHDVGQPNHAYDADLLHGDKLVARSAHEGERFLGLDGVERSLSEQDEVIADADRAVALAGVLGGAETAVNERTTRLFLESANFDPVRVRLTTKRHAVRTDASNRFEKSRTPFATPLAIQRFHTLLTDCHPQARSVGAVVDTFPTPPARVSVPASFSYIRGRLDPKISDQEIEQILSSLRFSIEKKGDQFVALVPAERATRDVTIEDDLVEEVGRIYGYERMAEIAPLIESSARPDTPIRAFENGIRDRLCGLGFSEAYLYSFMEEQFAARIGYPSQDAIRLLNPIDADRAVIRTSLVPGLLEMAERNAKYTDEMYLFEFGCVYRLATERPAGEQVVEGRRLGLISRAGCTEQALGASAAPPIDSGANFYAMRSVIERLVRILSPAPLVLTPCAAGATDQWKHARKWMHPFRAAEVSAGKTVVGVVAEVRPGLGKDLPERLVVAELDTDAILSLASRDEKFRPLAKYPDSFFEMSVVMPKRETYQQLESLLRSQVDPQVLRRIEVFSLYEGKPLPEGTKSVSVRFVLGSDARTLATEEVSGIQQSLMNAVRQSEYTLRG